MKVIEGLVEFWHIVVVPEIEPIGAGLTVTVRLNVLLHELLPEPEVAVTL